MSKKQRELMQGFRAFGKAPVQSFTATVVSVAGEYCSVDDDGYVYPEVRLRAAVNGNDNKVVLLPKVGSWVMVSRIMDGEDYFVSMVSEVDQVILKGDAFGGLVKIEGLIERLNAIETAFNQFLNEYKLHVHGGVTTGPGLSAVMTPVSTQINIQKTQRNDALENTEVVHG